MFCRLGTDTFRPANFGSVGQKYRGRTLCCFIGSSQMCGTKSLERVSTAMGSVVLILDLGCTSVFESLSVIAPGVRRHFSLTQVCQYALVYL